MKRSLIGLAVVGLLLAGVAKAEVRRGDVLLDFLAGYTQQNFSDDVGGDSLSVLFAAARPGYAFTDNIRAAIVGAVAWMDTPGGDITTWLVGPSAEYVFMPANQLNPFIGVVAAYVSADTDFGGTTDGWMIAPRGGFLYTLNSTNNLFGEFWWQFYGGDVGDILDDGFLILFGIEHKFKVGQ